MRVAPKGFAMSATSKSIGEIAFRRRLRDCSIEELAVEQIMRSPSGGVLFARNTERENKDAARLEIINLFRRDRFPKSLSILTLPGLEWKFERKLFGQREGDWYRMDKPRRTYFTCIENDRMLYHAAVTKMPGLHHIGSLTRVLPATEFAEKTVANPWIRRYFFGNVDDLMQQQAMQFDGAWLDYTGPMSLKRLKIISAFYDKCIRHTLVITSLKARWNREMSSAIAHAGGHSALIINHLHGTVEHDLEYQDSGSPMSQIAISKS